jgi:peptidoglycan/LPS O-acetylase OafA/YrhL
LKAEPQRNVWGVTAIILIGIAAAVIIGLSLTFGGPLVGAILAVVLIVGAIIWFITAARSGTTLGEIAREAPDQEFLGPGGPDDPSR